MNACGLIQRAWHWSIRGTRRAFETSLRDPMATQEALLHSYLKANAATAFGRLHGFESIRSIEAFQRRVPLTTYDSYEPFIDRIRAGERDVLTRDPVVRLVPSSGSTAACKLIPYTAALLREFQAAIGPWVAGLFDRWPETRDGPAYWAVSPAFAYDDGRTSAVPIGFDDDSAYLSPIARRLINRTLAVPSDVRHVADTDAFRYLTLLHLLRAGGLRLISVWHPSYLTLLLDAIEPWWDRLLEDLRRGETTPPVPVGGAAGNRRILRFKAAPGRAAVLRGCSPRNVEELWPRLRVVSCWTDAAAAGAAAEMGARLPQVDIQPKGLVATEAILSLPFAGVHPLAVRSHFFEFIDAGGIARTLDALRERDEYMVAVTTAGGLYRYALGDRVRVTGRIGNTPTIRFVGKEDRVSDLAGEKLSEGFVAGVLQRLLGEMKEQPVFAMLAPDDRGDGARGYTLYWQRRGGQTARISSRLNDFLADNPHYRHCLRLGQLAPARCFAITGDAHARFIAHRRERGTPLGQIKPATLSAESGWSQRFTGNYED